MMTERVTKSTTARRVVALALAAMLGACSTIDAARPRAAASGAPCVDPQSVTSAPGKAWWAVNRWRYADDAAATAAYVALQTTTPHWPDWFVPGDSTLAAGTRFQMAMAPGQTDRQPGSFGTFDDILNVADVREYLAVLYSWKPQVNRVVTYELVKPMPVKVGPIGPQVDPVLCRLLPGRWSQFQMMVPPADRISYLTVIAVRMLN